MAGDHSQWLWSQLAFTVPLASVVSLRQNNNKVFH
jgi:hypothetical protein